MSLVLKLPLSFLWSFWRAFLPVHRSNWFLFLFRYEVIDEEPDDDGGTGQRSFLLNSHPCTQFSVMRLLDACRSQHELSAQKCELSLTCWCGFGACRMYKLPPSCIIPFPKKTEASTAVDFAHGLQVLAVYPGTTALYKASVVGPPRKVNISCTSCL